MSGDLKTKRVADLARTVRTLAAGRAARPLEAALAIADAIADADPEAWGITLREVEEAGAGLSKSTLANYVRVRQLALALGEETSSQLSLTQHIALVSVPSPRLREALARGAVSQAWSASEFRRRVDEARRRGRSFRRRGLRTFARTAVTRTDALLSPERSAVDSFEGYAPEERDAVVSDLRMLVRRLRGVIDTLERGDGESLMERAEAARRSGDAME